MAESILNEVLPNLPQFNPRDFEDVAINYPNDDFP